MAYLLLHLKPIQSSSDPYLIDHQRLNFNEWPHRDSFMEWLGHFAQLLNYVFRN